MDDNHHVPNTYLDLLHRPKYIPNLHFQAINISNTCLIDQPTCPSIYHQLSNQYPSIHPSRNIPRKDHFPITSDNNPSNHAQYHSRLEFLSKQTQSEVAPKSETMHICIVTTFLQIPWLSYGRTTRNLAEYDHLSDVQLQRRLKHPNLWEEVKTVHWFERSIPAVDYWSMTMVNFLPSFISLAHTDVKEAAFKSSPILFLHHPRAQSFHILRFTTTAQSSRIAARTVPVIERMRGKRSKE